MTEEVTFCILTDKNDSNLNYVGMIISNNPSKIIYNPNSPKVFDIIQLPCSLYNVRLLSLNDDNVDSKVKERIKVQFLQYNYFFYIWETYISEFEPRIFYNYARLAKDSKMLLNLIGTIYRVCSNDGEIVGKIKNVLEEINEFDAKRKRECYDDSPCKRRRIDSILQSD